MMFATKDAAFGMAQCRVWNDFAWQMYGEYNDFMSPAAAIMTADVTLAIEEIKRVAKMGFRFLTLRASRSSAATTRAIPITT